MSIQIGPNIIILEQETKMPDGWKEGDMFKVTIGANGQVTLIKVTNNGVM